MSTSSPVRFLSFDRPVTEANERDALLKVFSGEIYNFMQDDVIVADKVLYKDCPAGADRVQFILTGEASAGYHNAGSRIVGQDFRTAEKWIRIDKPMVSAFEFYDFDSMLSQWDIRQEAATQAAHAISKTMDINALATIARASLVNMARGTGGSLLGPTETAGGGSSYSSANPFIGFTNESLGVAREARTGQPGGTVLNADLDFATSQITAAKNLYDKIVEASKALKRKNYNPNECWGVLPTDAWYAMLWARNADGFFINFHQDHMNPGLAGAPDRTHDVIKIAGITLYNANRFPDDDFTLAANPDYPQKKYTFPFSNCKAIIWHPRAAGTVIKAGIGVEVEREARYMQDFVNTYAFFGNDVLDPGACVTIFDDAVNGAALKTYADNAQLVYDTENGKP